MYFFIKILLKILYIKNILIFSFVFGIIFLRISQERMSDYW